MDESRTMSLEEAAAQLGVGRTLAYELARRGEFPCTVLRIGKLYRVPTAAINRVLEGEARTAVSA